MSGDDATSSSPLARRLVAGAALGGLVVLGILVVGSDRSTLAAPGSWEPVEAPMTVARPYHAAAAAPDGRIYAIGGFMNATSYSNTVEAYDPTKPEEGWKTVAPMPAPLSTLAATALRRRRTHLRDRRRQFECSCTPAHRRGSRSGGPGRGPGLPAPECDHGPGHPSGRPSRNLLLDHPAQLASLASRATTGAALTVSAELAKPPVEA